MTVSVWDRFGDQPDDEDRWLEQQTDSDGQVDAPMPEQAEPAELAEPESDLTQLTHVTPALTSASRVFRFADLPSECAEQVSAGNRVDPFYRDLWPVGSRASWVDIRTAKDQVATGRAKLPSHLTADEQEAEQRILDRPGPYLDVLAALDQFRVVTAEQLAAITGNWRLGSGRSKLMTDLFTVGAIDVGIFANALYNTRTADRGTLYRPGSSGFFDRKVSPELTYAEWLSVTAGQTTKLGGQGHDRHGVLASEAALRIAEFSVNVQYVVGERLSSAQLLGFTGLGIPVPEKAVHTKAGDFTVLRSDGARIVVELTATIGRALQQKIETWAQLLASRRMDQSGLAVVFLIAERPDGQKSGQVRNTVYKMIREACRKYPGPNFDRSASRFGVADWREWFPGEQQTSELLFTMAADRPVDPWSTDFERADFLDETQVPFNPDGDWASAALDNIGMLRGVPAWLRQDARAEVDLLPVLMEASGWDEIPVPVMSRPELAGDTFRNFGQEHGFAGAPKPPKRMRA